MKTFHIHINGIVQGVGFRPLVYQLAKEMGLAGYVKNGNDGLHVFFNTDDETAKHFFNKIKKRAPAQSTIISSSLIEIMSRRFAGFSIVVEDDDHHKNVLISPDKAICDRCKNELHDKNNRRYRYPFITCIHCGPRYSIIDRLPYERKYTSMKTFLMCSNCNAEYNNVTDPRFYSQTNSCDDCGIKLRMHGSHSVITSDDPKTILLNIRTLLSGGKIIAVKGIGGYLLLCDANDTGVVQLLRSRKHRATKPFAVLYPGIEAVEKHFELKANERELLTSEAAPILLLQPKAVAADHLKIIQIAPGLKRLGIMLPHSPLLELISADYGKPLIATSANISGSPIIYKDDVALEHLFQIADHIVSNDREIVVPQDDSVVQVSTYAEKSTILRRSRGLAPAFTQYQPRSKKVILSTGAFLKSSFSLAVNGNLFVSQYLGSGTSYEGQQMYKETASHWLKLYRAKPSVIITDKHPGYFSHQYAAELADKYNSHLMFVQHHEAHFAAVLAENNLLRSPEPVMGIIWDGTGLGNDGHIWGGEFFTYQHGSISRRFHFDYFPVIAGDKMAMEPRIAALCASTGMSTQYDGIRKKFSSEEWHNYQSLAKASHLFSSSVGRLFDAVASLLNICDKQDYEGEAAMYLQALAEDWVAKNGFLMDRPYCSDIAMDRYLPSGLLIEEIIADIKAGYSKNYIAAKFHYSMVCIIAAVAKYANVKKICFSGGVFQNVLLTDWLRKELAESFQLFFHSHLSPNDENISFGQLVYFDNKIVSEDRNDVLQKAAERKSEQPELSILNS